MIRLHARPVKDYLVPVAARPVLAGTKEEWILYQRNPSPLFHGRVTLEQLMRVDEADVHPRHYNRVNRGAFGLMEWPSRWPGDIENHS